MQGVVLDCGHLVWHFCFNHVFFSQRLEHVQQSDFGEVPSFHLPYRTSIPRDEMGAFSSTLLFSKQTLEACEINDGSLLVRGHIGTRQHMSNFKTDASPRREVASKPTISDFIDTHISGAFSRALIQAVYTGLLHAIPIQICDYSRVLSACEEISLDLDLTHFLNVLTLRRKKSCVKTTV